VVAIPEHADRDLANPDELAGAIAVVRRGGDNGFAEKAKYVQAAGALGMICISCTKPGEHGNNAGDQLFRMGPNPDQQEAGHVSKGIKIPCVLVKESDGPAVMAALGTEASLVLGGDLKYPLRSRFWGPIPDAEVAHVIKTQSLLTPEELEKIAQDKADEQKVERLKMLVARVGQQKGQELVMQLAQQVNGMEDPSAALAAVEEFCTNHDVSVADEDENAAQIEKDRQDLAAALEQAGAVLGPDMVRDMQGQIAQLPPTEQIAALASFSGLTFDLPSAHPDPVTPAAAAGAVATVKVEFDQGVVQRSQLQPPMTEFPLDAVYRDLMPGVNDRIPTSRVVVGARIVASHPQYGDDNWFEATVREVESLDKVHVEYDDGDRAVIGLERIRLQVGLTLTLTLIGSASRWASP
jgi:hypothetical protein